MSSIFKAYCYKQTSAFAENIKIKYNMYNKQIQKWKYSCKQRLSGQALR